MGHQKITPAAKLREFVYVSNKLGATRLKAACAVHTLYVWYWQIRDLITFLRRILVLLHPERLTDKAEKGWGLWGEGDQRGSQGLTNNVERRSLGLVGRCGSWQQG